MGRAQRAGRRGGAGGRLLVACASATSEERVLDLGCGGRPLALKLCDRAGTVSFVSPDVRAVRRLREEADRQGAGNVKAVLGDALRQSPDAPFDVAVYEPVRWAAKGWVFKQIDEAFQVLRRGGRLCLGGRKDGGVESYKARLEAVFGNAALVSKKGGVRCYVARKETPSPAVAPVETRLRVEIADLPGGPYRFDVEAGVFSRDGLDEGTRFLIETMAVGESDRVLDLGCGAGPVGVVAARMAHEGCATLLDADLRAVRCASLNVALNDISNARVALSDAFEAVSGDAFDLIVSNPPSHEGASTARAFVSGAARHLRSGGRFLVVSTRSHLYRSQMEKRFRKVEETAARAPYSVLLAADPKRA